VLVLAVYLFAVILVTIDGVLLLGRSQVYSLVWAIHCTVVVGRWWCCRIATAHLSRGWCRCCHC
jgi:hypothetical protein